MPKHLLLIFDSQQPFLMKLSLLYFAIIQIIASSFVCAEPTRVSGYPECNAKNPYETLSSDEIVGIGIAKTWNDVKSNQIRRVDALKAEVHSTFEGCKTGSAVWQRELMDGRWTFYVVFYNSKSRPVACAMFYNGMMPYPSLRLWLLESHEDGNVFVPEVLPPPPYPPKRRQFGFTISEELFEKIFALGKRAGVVEKSGRIGEL
ncbi:MAG TPA: hypothetical protein VGH90_12245 [Chthoniobacteraceae bacterium]|jgi:hypothetical protein